MATLRCDIFCTVIDNFGDIGVCWRLARQLSSEHGLKVRLWVDDLGCFQHMAPTIILDQAIQTLGQLEICRWDSAADTAYPADIVIAAFGCHLPQPYLENMAGQTIKPAWINLEYLSAEAWVEGCHTLPSPHPQLPITCYFFFPGMTPLTGGLLRERALRDSLRHFQTDPAAQNAFWSRLTPSTAAPEALKISLFCYENSALPALLDAWAQSPRPVFCAVPEGRILPAVLDWAGASLHHGNLQLAILPFLSHEDYDYLLAACDLNFVRGEDSFVRAQWAGRPLVWHIYQQDEQAHRIKLDAFLDRYTRGLDAPACDALNALWHAWDEGKSSEINWEKFVQHLDKLRAQAEGWAVNQSNNGDLSSKLLIFCKNLLE
jgi:uncharacterized repeat protein (TIGR03837 family)